MGLPQETPTKLYVDNAGAVELAKDAKTCHRSRHVLRRFFKVREWQHERELQTEWIATARNTADMFTKASIRPADFTKHKNAAMHIVVPSFTFVNVIVGGAFNLFEYVRDHAATYLGGLDLDDDDDDDWADGVEAEDPCDFCGQQYTCTGDAGTCEFCSLVMCSSCMRHHACHDTGRLDGVATEECPPCSSPPYGCEHKWITYGDCPAVAEGAVCGGRFVACERPHCNALKCLDCGHTALLDVPQNTRHGFLDLNEAIDLYMLTGRPNADDTEDRQPTTRDDADAEAADALGQLSAAPKVSPSRFLKAAEIEIATGFATDETLRSVAMAYGCKRVNDSTLVAIKTVIERHIGTSPYQSDKTAWAGAKVAGGTFKSWKAMLYGSSTASSSTNADDMHLG